MFKKIIGVPKSVILSTVFIAFIVGIGMMLDPSMIIGFFAVAGSILSIIRIAEYIRSGK